MASYCLKYLLRTISVFRPEHIGVYCAYGLANLFAAFFFFLDCKCV